MVVEGITGARRGCLAFDGEGDRAAGGAGLALGGEGGLANEGLWFVPCEEGAESGFERGDVRAEFVAVERQASFEAEGVAGSEAGGENAVRLAGGEEVVPEGFGRSDGKDEFEAVFSGVAGACDPEIAAVPVGEEDAVAWGEVRKVGQSGAKDRGGKGALEGKGGGFGRGVVEGDAGGEVALHPVVVGLDHGGVDDEEKGFRVGAIEEEVVEDTAGFKQEEGVLALAGGEFGDVVGEEPVEVGERVWAGDPEFAHVGDIKEAGLGANGVVFLEDAGVLDGHEPAAEGDHSGTEAAVDGIEGNVAEDFWRGHGGGTVS